MSGFSNMSEAVCARCGRLDRGDPNEVMLSVTHVVGGVIWTAHSDCADQILASVRGILDPVIRGTSALDSRLWRLFARNLADEADVIRFLQTIKSMHAALANVPEAVRIESLNEWTTAIEKAFAVFNLLPVPVPSLASEPPPSPLPS